MGLEGEIVDLKTIANIVMLYGQKVRLSLTILVAGLLAAKIAVKYLRRILDRFMANRVLAAAGGGSGLTA